MCVLWHLEHRFIPNPCHEDSTTQLHWRKKQTLPTSHSFTLMSVTGSSAAFSESWFFLTTLNPGSRPTPLTPSPYMSGLHWMKKTYRCSDLQEKQTGDTMKLFTDHLDLEIAPCWLYTTRCTKAHWNTNQKFFSKQEAVLVSVVSHKEHMSW